MNPQNVRKSNQDIMGAFRSRNLAIRNNEIALIIPNGSKQDWGFINAQTGELKRSFLTALDLTTRAEFHYGSAREAGDLRAGQFFVYWHENGNIYARSAGDDGERMTYNTANGSLVMPFVGRGGVICLVILA